MSHSDYEAPVGEWLEGRELKGWKHVDHVVDERFEYVAVSGEYGDAGFGASDKLRSDGCMTWVVIYHSARRPRLKPVLSAEAGSGRISWIPGDSLIGGDGNPKFSPRIKRADPISGSSFYAFGTCKFRIEDTGSETVDTAIAYGAESQLDPLLCKFECLEKSKEATVVMDREKIDVVILSVREDEFTSVCSRIHNPEFEEHERIILVRGCLRSTSGKDIKVAVARCVEQGQKAAMEMTENVFDACDPNYLFLIGIGGAVPSPEFGLGDVVLSSKVIDLSVSAAKEGEPLEFAASGGRFSVAVEKVISVLPALQPKLGPWWDGIGADKPEPDEIESLDDDRLYGDGTWKKGLVANLKARAKVARHPIAISGSTITGETLTKSTEIVKQWESVARDTADIEMELGGVYKACARRGDSFPKLFCVRGISDIVGLKRDPGWTAFACESAASYATALIESGLLRFEPK